MAPLRRCLNYAPKFRSAGAVGGPLENFIHLYSNDPLYASVGLNSPLMFAVHKASGGMTSIYRQLGRACESLYRAIIEDSTQIDPMKLSWQYVSSNLGSRSETLTLDAKIDLADLQPEQRRRMQRWMKDCIAKMPMPPEKINTLKGAVFEIRQGYKTKDSKRQNADLRFANRALGEDLLPVMMLASAQVDEDIYRRYMGDNLHVLVGSRHFDPSLSTFAFFDRVLGYDLIGFYERNSMAIKSEMELIFKKILSPSDPDGTPESLDDAAELIATSDDV